MEQDLAILLLLFDYCTHYLAFRERVRIYLFSILTCMIETEMKYHYGDCEGLLSLMLVNISPAPVLRSKCRCEIKANFTNKNYYE